MCFGGGNNEHHRQEEIRRQGQQAAAAAHQAELDRRASLEAMQRQQEAAKRDRDAMLAQLENAKDPYKVKTAEDAGSNIMGLRNKTNKQKTSVRDLRIARNPTVNVGNTDKGTNIG